MNTQERILNFTNDLQMREAMVFFHTVNSAVKKLHPQKLGYNLEPSQGVDSFTVRDKNSRFNNRKVRLNATVPNEELFSLAQELVKAADEPFAARTVFELDNSFHEGSQTIGYDVEIEQGEAKLVASGRTASTIPRADFKVGRTLQHVGKLMSGIEVTRDDMQLLALRRDRGMSPFVDLMQGKLRLARKHISRMEDSIVWLGGDIENTTDGEVQGLFNRLSITSGDFTGKAPSHGQHKTGLAPWSGLTADAIIAQLAAAVEYITRNNAYFPDTLVLPPFLMFGGSFSLKRTSDTDSTPLVEWIKRAFLATFKKELNIVASNAIKAGDVSGSQRGNAELSADAFLLLDSQKDYQAIAVVEDMTLLPSKEDEEGTIKQIVQMKTGGLLVKHPSAMYLGEGIAVKT